MEERNEGADLVAKVKAAAIEIMTGLVEEIGWLDHAEASELAEAALENLEERLDELTTEHPLVRDRTSCRGDIRAISSPGFASR
jgi:hypothetical protein